MQKYQKVLILSRASWVIHSIEEKKRKRVTGMSSSSDASSDSGHLQFSVKIPEA